jgi:hypothetical protein
VWVQAVKLCSVRWAAQVVALPPAARGAAAPPVGELGVAGDPSTSRSGARTFAGSPATWRLLSLRGWGETHESRRDRQLYGVEVTGISARRPSPREVATLGDASATRHGARQIGKRPIPKKRIRIRPRCGQGAHGRLATRCTTRGVANGLSTPDNDPGDPARGWPAEHANHGSDEAAHCVPPTATTRYRRCLPARRACRAAPRLPAEASGPEPGPPSRPPAVQPGIDLPRIDQHRARNNLDMRLTQGLIAQPQGTKCRAG